MKTKLSTFQMILMILASCFQKMSTAIVERVIGAMRAFCQTSLDTHGRHERTRWTFDISAPAHRQVQADTGNQATAAQISGVPGPDTPALRAMGRLTKMVGTATSAIQGTLAAMIRVQTVPSPS